MLEEPGWETLIWFSFTTMSFFLNSCVTRPDTTRENLNKHITNNIIFLFMVFSWFFNIFLFCTLSFSWDDMPKTPVIAFHESEVSNSAMGVCFRIQEVDPEFGSHQPISGLMETKTTGAQINFSVSIHTETGLLDPTPEILNKPHWVPWIPFCKQQLISFPHCDTSLWRIINSGPTQVQTHTRIDLQHSYRVKSMGLNLDNRWVSDSRIVLRYCYRWIHKTNPLCGEMRKALLDVMEKLRKEQDISSWNFFPFLQQICGYFLLCVVLCHRQVNAGLVPCALRFAATPTWGLRELCLLWKARQMLPTCWSNFPNLFLQTFFTATFDFIFVVLADRHKFLTPPQKTQIDTNPASGPHCSRSIANVFLPITLFCELRRSLLFPWVFYYNICSICLFCWLNLTHENLFGQQRDHQSW